MQQIIFIIIICGAAAGLRLVATHGVTTQHSQMSPAAFLWQIMIKIPHLHSQLRPGHGQRGVISWKNSFYTEILRQIFWHDLDLTPTWAEYKISGKCMKSLCFVFREVLFFSAPYTDTKVDVNKRCWPSMLTHFSYIF